MESFMPSLTSSIFLSILAGETSANTINDRRTRRCRCRRRRRRQTANVVQRQHASHQIVLIPSPLPILKALHSIEILTLKQRDSSVSGHKKLCSLHNLAILTEVLSAALELSKAITSQDERVISALTGNAVVEVHRTRWYEHV